MSWGRAWFAGVQDEADFDSLRLLVVEDNAVFARVLQMTIVERGHRCDVLDTIPAAIQAVAAGAYDAVVADKYLARGDGTQLLREVAWRSPRTARVLMSGVDLERGLDPALAHACLLKPFEPSRLFDVVERFGRHRLLVSTN